MCDNLSTFLLRCGGQLWFTYMTSIVHWLWRAVVLSYSAWLLFKLTRSTTTEDITTNNVFNKVDTHSHSAAFNWVSLNQNQSSSSSQSQRTPIVYQTKIHVADAKRGKLWPITKETDSKPIKNICSWRQTGENVWEQNAIGLLNEKVARVF